MWDNILLALGSLRANKLRALLTMLGIIIGIGSVIAIVTVGNSLTSSVSDSLVAMGGNNMQVQLSPKPDENGEMPDSYSISDTDMMTDEMLEAFRQRFANSISAIALTSSGDQGKVQRGRLSASVTPTGINDEYIAAKRVKLIAGRDFRQQDFDGTRRVAIVSDKLVNKLYGGDNSAILGQTLSVTSENSVDDFLVIGVYKHEAVGIPLLTGTPSENAPTELYIPLSTANQMRQQSGYLTGYYYFELIPTADVNADSLVTRSEQFFNDRYYQNNPTVCIKTYNLKNEMSSITSVLSTIKLAIGVIAGISLLVGGIGVMNIMTVSVTERTREIGVRKALGAPAGAIRTQFIVESIVICLIGGALGILVGLGLGSVGSTLMGTAAKPDLGTILIAEIFSMGIGVFFGYYPASKAAKLDPIEALRYE